MTERLERLCEVCGNAGFSDGGDGFFYCGRCGSQADDIIDMAVDDDDLFGAEGGGGGIYKKIFARASTRGEDLISDFRQSQSQNLNGVWLSQSQDLDSFKSPEDDEKGPTEPSDFAIPMKKLSYDDYSNEIRLRYVMGVQVMIQLQCKALVEKFNVSPLIVGMVGPIWLRFLASKGIMCDEWANNEIHQSESQTQGEIEQFMPMSRHRAEPHNLLGKRAVTIWYRSLSSAIPLYCSLAVSFLVCHIAREAILPTDILKWAREGKLPYFSAFIEIEKQLGPPSSACPISSSRMFRPVQVITLQKLESLAASIARKIGLELPPVNFFAIASRYLEKLSLPAEKVLAEACRICEWSMPPELYLSANEFRLPTRVYVMAILIVTIRILYNFNGGKWEMTLSSSSSPSELADTNQNKIHSEEKNEQGRPKRTSAVKATIDEGKDESLHNSENLDESDFDASELLQILESKYDKLDDAYEYYKDLPSYLEYCKDVVFAGLEPSYEDHEEEKIMEDLWDFYQTRKCVKPKQRKTVMDGERDLGTSQDSTSYQEDRYPLEGNNCSSRHKDPLNEACPLESHKEEAIRKLKSDMQDNRFYYIPPKKNCNKKGYVRYARKKEGGVYIYVAHADYYILLRSCAKVAQVDVRTMHVGVLAFEKRLEWLEKRINSCLQKRPPIDYCDLCCDEEVKETLNDSDTNAKKR